MLLHVAQGLEVRAVQTLAVCRSTDLQQPPPIYRFWVQVWRSEGLMSPRVDLIIHVGFPCWASVMMLLCSRLVYTERLCLGCALGMQIDCVRAAVFAAAASCLQLRKLVYTQEDLQQRSAASFI